MLNDLIEKTTQCAHTSTFKLCNAFWQRGNNQTINANFHKELNICICNGMLIRQNFCSFHLLLFFVLAHLEHRQLILEAVYCLFRLLLLWHRYIVLHRFLSFYTHKPWFPDWNFKNYSHVLRCASSRLRFSNYISWTLVENIVYSHTIRVHCYRPSEWSHKSCDRWL